jgi:hypothetical protein
MPGPAFTGDVQDASGNYHQRLHGLDLSTGAEQSGSPTTIEAAFPTPTGILTFDPAQYKESAGLLLRNGMIYLSWAPHCDHTPYNGWAMGYSETTLKQVSVLNLTLTAARVLCRTIWPLTIPGRLFPHRPWDI